jgi:hypothetical protein
MSILGQCRILLVVMFLCCGLAVCLQSPESARPKVTLREYAELRTLGGTIAAAVLKRDVNTLTKYSRADLRQEEQQALQDKNSRLYCYMFNSSCIRPRGKSVLSVLKNAKKLGIKVRPFGWASNGAPFAMILFYDAEAFQPSDLTSSRFLCEKSRFSKREIVSWTFRRQGQNWVSDTPMFDSETDLICSD